MERKPTSDVLSVIGAVIGIIAVPGFSARADSFQNQKGLHSMQTDQIKSQRPAQPALLSAPDAFRARLAEPVPREDEAELFIRLLLETLETDRLVRAAMQMNVAKGRVENFSKRIRADVQEELLRITPMDCFQQMTQGPKPGTT